jgi:hypothetical protein
MTPLPVVRSSLEYLYDGSLVSSGATYWPDLSGNGHLGTITNGIYDATYGGSFMFTGKTFPSGPTNQFTIGGGVNVGYPNNIDFSLNFWFSMPTMLTGVSGTYQTFRQDAISSSPFILGVKNRRFNVILNSYYNLSPSSQQLFDASVGSLLPNTPVNCCATFKFSEKRLKIYVNNVLLFNGTSTVTPFAIASSTGDYQAPPDSAPISTGVRIYQISQYNKQLSDAEVTQNWDAVRGRFGL